MNIRSQRREETREKILEAARHCFGSAGFDATSTREIAQRAGVAEGTVFAHFPTKEELLVTCVGDQMAAVIERALHTMDPEWSLPDKLMHVAACRFEQVCLQPEMWRVLMSQIAFSPRKGAVHQVMANSGLIAATRAIIEEAQLNGEIDPDLDPVLVFKTIMALFLFTIHDHMSSGNFDSEDMCATLRELVELQVRGIWLHRGDKPVEN
ncbi:TetR/AcrR family transcriptional regulator [Thalassospira sp.]|uniref:TetR/AcrR family transcriptional regulator n=1 Tax=Thalassospira sp. TaxID=1912094 RepID=UPI00273771D5|nr:TetR/AcrR family transcriptional regulator [Thalassospira sp.]MDP2697046.1 TetR/AcrR family transcriptional regulator [Thalassospira sp.]